ncbi:MAG: PD40 domain-containing protein [Flavobacteriales bacterium]|nr:PD40 domain-containing protein [Flavobacteriales bacterium]
MFRSVGSMLLLMVPGATWAQGGSKEQRAQADALFAKGEYAQAYAAYENLLGNDQQDFDLNFRYGVCALYAGADKEAAIAYLKRSTQGPAPDALSWYFLGKAYHLTYRFKEALVAYERFRGTADKKVLSEYPVDAVELQCRNGQNLLSNLKEIDVHNKVEVVGSDFFRFYDLSSIGGRIVVTPDELKTSADKKSKDLALVYLPDKGGSIYFASYGKSSGTGRDIYRTELMPNGEFATPVKLAGYINTEEDEDYPFMAPDGKSFYFCSKGHNSMGGYDVFKSSYDKGLDVFGAPVNMDFAVNTPDDDLFYLTDPEGKEACFASGRESKQGMLHVYRVNTAQAPLNITVLKGTFASQLNTADRKAHITVVDMLTQETVADVRTGLDGDYVLSLPRNGRYKFMVEAGANGKTHVGMVDIPRNEEPRAYRQEMSLVDQGGEKLMIKNYFDTPLEEDMIALAMDEIRRRAKLEVGTHAVVAEVPLGATAEGDVLTRAGFAGDITKPKALALAKEDADALTQATGSLEVQANAAYSIALENASLADAASRKAETLVAQANATSDESEKNSTMMQAARERQTARAANQRATAAYRAGQELETEQLATSLKAQKATRLATELTTLLAGKEDNATVIKLVELKRRMDEKNAPDGSITAAEKMRRSATDREREAAALLVRANTARAEENDLTDRVARKKRETSEAKGGKKQTLANELAELETQLGALQEENDQAFTKARMADRSTTVARGQAELAKRLATDASSRTVSELTNDQIAQLGQRIATTDSRTDGLAVDARFDAALAEEARQLEQRTFDWGEPLAPSGDLASTATQVADRDNQGDASRTEGNTVLMDAAAMEAKRVKEGGAVQVPQIVPSGNGTNNTGIEQDPNKTVGTEVALAPNSLDTVTTSTKTSGGISDGMNEPSASGNQGTQVANATEPRKDLDLASAQGIGTVSNEQPTEQDGRVEETAPVRPEVEVEERAFVLSNELAELKQLRSAEKNKARKTALDERITAVETELRAGQELLAEAKKGSAGIDQTPTSVPETVVTPSPGTITEPLTEVATQGSELNNTKDPRTGTERSNVMDNALVAGSPEEAQRLSDSLSAAVPPLEFAPAVNDRDLLAGIFTDYANDKQKITNTMADPQERGTSLHGLELMLVDSIDAENSRQLAYLEKHPEEASTVLGRSDRLRVLKEAHVQEAERVLAEGQQQYAAQESRLLEAAALAQGSEKRSGESNVRSTSSTPHNDDYITVVQDPEQVYNSPLDLRSVEAVAELKELNERNDAVADLEDRIDSLETVIESMPAGKARDKQRLRTDRLIDDHMILRTEIGQSMGFYTRAEFKTAQDSVKVLNTAVAKLGLGASEPMNQLAAEMERHAKEQMDQAGQKRKKAERTEDIVLRDSLYRSAYAQELGGLRDIDRSLTVRNYMLKEDFQRGEQLAYEIVERKMFGSAETASPLDAVASKPLVDGNTGADGSGSATIKEPTGLSSVARYKELMAADTTGKSVTPMTAEDPGMFRTEAMRSAQEAVELEKRSVLISDQANEKTDSATTANRSDRERLEREAYRLRALSDSLHLASIQAEKNSDEFAQKSAKAVETSAFNQRLLKFYYLNNQEQALVLNEEDHSRYFEAKAKALEQREEAARTLEQAEGAKRLADALLQQSKEILANPDAGGVPLTPVQMAQASQLTDQAVRMQLRSDSLRKASDRNVANARMNEAQAASVLQGLDAQRGTEIMALEQATRRVEPALAEARSMGSDIVPTVVPPANTIVSAEIPNNGTGRDNEAVVTLPPGVKNTTPPNDLPVSDNVNALPVAGQPVAEAPTSPIAAPELLAPLTSDIFSIADRDAARIGSIPINAPMPRGVVFKVQIGAFKQAISAEVFKDLSPVAGEAIGNGLVRYSAGEFTSAQNAVRATQQVRDRGYRDAFVVAYQDGKRVSLSQAMRAAQPVAAQPSGTVATIDPVRPPTEIRPVPVPITSTLSDSSAEVAVLANYPATAEQLLAQFAPPADATAYYNAPGAAPARQVETVKGLFYTVQVGVYSKPTALDRLFNITPLNSERTETNKIRYTTGVFTDMGTARSRKDQTVGLGVKDAFITAYLNGKRIPMRDARALIARFGPSVFADPAIITR